MLFSNFKYEKIPGDIGLVDGKGFVANAIKFFMNKWRKVKKLPPRKLYNHAFMIIDVWGIIHVAEALVKGITIRPLIKTPYATCGGIKENVRILTPRKKYTEVEKKKISKVAVLYALNPTRYDFMNFWYQMRMILSGGKWRGPTNEKATDRLYCSEAVATWANVVRPRTFKNPAATNLLDIDINRYYKVKSLRGK